MKAQEGDYLIYSDQDKVNKNRLMQVVREKESAYKGIDELDRHLKEQIITVPKKSVLVNLGPTPKPGVIYGVDARDIYKKTITHDGWGDVHFFTHLDKDVLKALRKELDHTADVISKNKMEKLFNKICIEIRSPRGKYAGMYKHSKDKDAPGRLKLFLKEDHATQMAYVLYHEFGHAIRFNCLTNPKIVASWLRLFNTSILVGPVEEHAFRSMFKQIKRAESESLSSVRKLISEDDDEDRLRVLKTAVRFISQVHKVQPKEVSTLMVAGKFDLLEELWPQRDIDVNDLHPIVTEYAGKNVEELFAEAYAFYMTKKKLPKGITALMEKSLAVAKDTVKYLGLEDEQ